MVDAIKSAPWAILIAVFPLLAFIASPAALKYLKVTSDE
jgi:hypothetical protein